MKKSLLLRISAITGMVIAMICSTSCSKTVDPPAPVPVSITVTSAHGTSLNGQGDTLTVVTNATNITSSEGSVDGNKIYLTNLTADKDVTITGTLGNQKASKTISLKVYSAKTTLLFYNGVPSKADFQRIAYYDSVKNNPNFNKWYYYNSTEIDDNEYTFYPDGTLIGKIGKNFLNTGQKIVTKWKWKSRIIDSAKGTVDPEGSIVFDNITWDILVLTKTEMLWSQVTPDSFRPNDRSLDGIMHKHFSH